MKKLILIGLTLFSIQLNAQDYTKVIRETSNDHEHYGWSVAVSKEWLIVGSPHSNTEAGADAGKVHIYAQEGDSWIEFQEITQQNGISFENFGYSVAIKDDWLAIGAIGGFQWGPFTGLVNLYKFNGVNWDLVKEYLPSDEKPNQWFGYSVALNNDYLAIGAINADGVNAQSGEVHIYGDYSTDQEKHYILASDVNKANDNFGYDIAINDENLIIVGAPDEDGGNNGSGAAYVYNITGDEWTLMNTLTSDHQGISDQFGTSVDIFKSKIVVGSLLGDGVSENSGAVHYFELIDDNWELKQLIHASDGQINDYFGKDVKIYNRTIMVGAPKAEVNELKHAGKVYVFSQEDDVWSQSEVVVEPIPGKDNHFGSSLDVINSRVLISALLNDELAADAGQIYLSTELITATDLIELEPITGVMAYPVPANVSIRISYKLFRPYKVNLHIYDLNGKLVKSILDNSIQQSGNYSMEWDLQNNSQSMVEAGIYIYKLQYNGNVFSGKLVIK